MLATDYEDKIWQSEGVLFVRIMECNCKISFVIKAWKRRLKICRIADHKRRGENKMFEYLKRYKQNFPDRKFYQLIDKIYDENNLLEAWQKVKSNKGCAGADEQSIHDFWLQKDVYIAEIQRQLRNGSYKPSPVLRRYIPKDNGELRPLGIPTIKDRVVQQATKNVLEQIFEIKFKDCSFGFRPDKNAHQAINQIIKYLKQGYTWIIDADIKTFFDKVDHDLLIKFVAKEISDGKVLNLIEEWLKSGVMTDRKIEAIIEGTPQGGVISPLLANIYLHELDEEITSIESVKLVRYADDFVIMCKTEYMAEQAMIVLKKLMERLKLNLNEKKTKMADMKQEKLEFLGFVFSLSKGNVFFKPKKESLKKFKDKVKTITAKKLPLKPKEMIGRLNRVIRGWGNYFKIGHVKASYKELDVWIRMRCRLFIEKKKSRHSHHRLPNIVLKSEYKLASLITLTKSRSL